MGRPLGAWADKKEGLRVVTMFYLEVIKWCFPWGKVGFALTRIGPFRCWESIMLKIVAFLKAKLKSEKNTK